MVRKIKQEDKDIFMEFVKSFYNSDAVLQPIPEQYHINTFNELMRSDIYLSCYIFEYKDKPVGYALTTKSFSQEAGGIALWIDELFVLPGYRSKGLGTEFFSFLKQTIDPSVARIRLEVEPENKKALKLYNNLGLKKLPYLQMVKELNNNFIT